MTDQEILTALFDGETVDSLKTSLGLTVTEINTVLHNTDFVVCNHCHSIENISGLIGTNTNQCPKCGYTISGV